MQVKQNFERFISCKTTIDDIYVKLQHIESTSTGISTEILYSAIQQVRQMLAWLPPCAAVLLGCVGDYHVECVDHASTAMLYSAIQQVRHMLAWLPYDAAVLPGCVGDVDCVGNSSTAMLYNAI
jgi:hypothetical protein